ncbi:hypothetical protein ACJMK2_026833 [Sinanodonta woodiana]|uniref:Zinc finger protein ZPR1 n=1 Tax=Sinanodonta woodiana TaxID=1069815 RepID=A0ABD3XLA5_SINWO
MDAKQSHPKSLFRNIDASDDDPEVTEIESLCVNCMKQGVTRIFLTRIPFFKEVILSSFMCEHCGFRNAEEQSGSRIDEKGIKYTLHVRNKQDMNRMVVQTSSAALSIPEIEFEVALGKAAITTVEGILDKAIQGLEQNQELRRIQDPDVASKIDIFLKTLNNLKEIASPFTMVLDDPSGNSFVENPMAPAKDPQLNVERYKRNEAQNEALGLSNEEEEQMTDHDNKPFTAKDEVATFQTNCPKCNAPCPTNMKSVDIPHFKEVIIMATVCDICGHRDNEVKGGAGTEPKGTRIELHITDRNDLSRDVIKSETSFVEIPELELSSDFGTLGGKFTTVEGLLLDIEDSLGGTNPFLQGDSADRSQANNLQKICDALKEVRHGKRLGVHLILDDPAGNSYIQNVHAPEEDPELKIIHYERSYEQNEVLGLNDMKTENYS